MVTPPQAGCSHRMDFLLHRPAAWLAPMLRGGVTWGRAGKALDSAPDSDGRAEHAQVCALSPHSWCLRVCILVHLVPTVHLE